MQQAVYSVKELAIPVPQADEKGCCKAKQKSVIARKTEIFIDSQATEVSHNF